MKNVRCLLPLFQDFEGSLSSAGDNIVASLKTDRQPAGQGGRSKLDVRDSYLATLTAAIVNDMPEQDKLGCL